ncbi:MAG: glycosyltransferase [Candidatus Hydrogenedentes bacterium]|nr:glycosyltransferase [Candidatus Hydrogenedentota bacterium]
MDTPRVSIIIPSWDGHRDGCVPRLLESVERQTFSDYETIIIEGVSPQGRAINQGASQAKGELLLILDDDSMLADEHVFERIVAAIDSDERIGMAGASIVIFPDSNAFQKKAAHQFPRFHTPVVNTITDSDLACHGCCAIPKQVFEEIGREREDILRGLDPDLRVRLRNAGYRVVLVPQARIHHPLPASWGKLLRIFFRNGFGSAYAYKFQPDCVYETHEELHDANFQPRTTLLYRIGRYPLRLLKALATFQTMRFGAYCSYALGYGWGLLTARKLNHG